MKVGDLVQLKHDPHKLIGLVVGKGLEDGGRIDNVYWVRVFWPDVESKSAHLVRELRVLNESR